MASGKKLKIKLVRSLNGRLRDHKACAAGLGLRRMNQAVVREDTPAVRGMVNKLCYLVSVEEC